MKPDVWLSPLRVGEIPFFVECTKRGVGDETFPSAEEIERMIEEGEPYKIMFDYDVAGGAIVKTDGQKGTVELLFLDPDRRDKKGLSFARHAIKEQYPDIKVWEPEI